jgi:hypothetical protein
MTDDAPQPRAVQFSVRIRDESDLASVGRRVEQMLEIHLSPYSGKYLEGPALAATVLGVWVALVRVDSLQVDAPQRYQLQGRQPPEDKTRYRSYNDIDDYILHVLGLHEPGRWYRPSHRELRIDAGVQGGRIQDEV